jgi:ATP-dependent DNA helicase RecG
VTPPSPAGGAPARRLAEPRSRLQFLPGVGPERARHFERLELFTVEDLLRHYPRAWLDARRFVAIEGLAPGTLLTVRGRVRQAAALRTRGGRTDFSLTLEDGTGRLGCYFFGQGFLARTLKVGVDVVVSGEVDAHERTMLNPMFEVLEGDVAELLHVGRLVPVHALTRGLSARLMRRAVRAALEDCADQVPDPLPAAVAAAHGFPSLGASLRAIHFPADEAERSRARERLAFEELFVLQSVLECRRGLVAAAGRRAPRAGSGALVERAVRGLPWPLTDDQRRALEEITADLVGPHAMHRLLLGDVGSGKTVVALLAALHVVEGGHRVAFMAPTEILARQHGATLRRLAAPVGVPIEVVTGSTPAAERRALEARLREAEPRVVVGTHALLEDKLAIPDLGLAIVDEQHRFGVRQRATLTSKGAVPDLLVLTATPIPRTLTLAWFGDLDVSRLAARPAGRGRLVTRVTGEEKFPQVLEFLARELDAGRQAYIVLPSIEESGRPDVRAAEAEFRRLRALPSLKRHALELLHGRLKADEKRRIMEGFASGAVAALVTTTVIEVGVDVANATLMIVESAERFGLTQLHQLRGRVGRGPHRSVCVLVAGPTAGALARERLAVLANSEDGFAIAEQDLRLRGPGEPWGTRQSGLPRLKLADLSRDETLLEDARRDARAVLAGDARLDAPEHAVLKRTLLDRYREALEMLVAG